MDFSGKEIINNKKYFKTNRYHELILIKSNIKNLLTSFNNNNNNNNNIHYFIYEILSVLMKIIYNIIKHDR